MSVLKKAKSGLPPPPTLPLPLYKALYGINYRLPNMPNVTPALQSPKRNQLQATEHAQFYI